MELDNAQVIALTKAIKDAAAKAARSGLSVGTHAVDYNVNVKGTLTVGEDEQYIPTVCIPIKAAFALFIRYCGITRTAAENALIQAMSEALQAQQRGADTVATVEGAISEEDAIIAACEQRVTAMVGELPKQTRRGKVLSKLTVTPLAV